MTTQLKNAVKHVTNAWFPVNGEALRFIQGGLQNGRYDRNLALLVDDLKCDMSLFLICMRELNRLVQHTPGHKPRSLSEQMEELGVHRIRSLLGTGDHLLSDYNCTEMTQDQCVRLREALQSACITEVLATEQQIDPTLAYSTALIRQLGLTLIAWNYPRVYSRVIATTDSPSERDEALTRLLGFSPSLLAMSVVRDWGLSDEVWYALRPPSEAEQPAIPHDRNQVEVGAALTKLCQIGEALARCSDTYGDMEPHADWNRARNEILRTLGTAGFRAIEERVSETLRFYRNTLPHMFPEDRSLTALLTREAPTHNLLQANPYLKYLPERVQHEMQALYENIDPKAVSKDTIDRLTKSIIPQCGFLRGCIYLFDPGTATLVPRLALGDRGLASYSPFTPGFLSLLENPLATAYRVTTPVVEEDVNEQGERAIKFIAGALGSMQRVGVLYLEPNGDLAQREMTRVVTSFKALRVALCDCLTLT